MTASAWRLLRKHAWFVSLYARLWEAALQSDPAAERITDEIEAELRNSLPAVEQHWDTRQLSVMMRALLRNMASGPT